MDLIPESTSAYLLCKNHAVVGGILQARVQCIQLMTCAVHIVPVLCLKLNEGPWQSWVCVPSLVACSWLWTNKIETSPSSIRDLQQQPLQSMHDMCVSLVSQLPVLSCRTCRAAAPHWSMLPAAMSQTGAGSSLSDCRTNETSMLFMLKP